MCLASETCSRSDWKTHYNQAGFFFFSFHKASHIPKVCFVSSVRQLQLLETRPHLRCGAFWMESHSDWEHHATVSLKHCYGSTSGLVLSKQQRGSKLFLCSKEWAIASEAQTLQAHCFIKMKSDCRAVFYWYSIGMRGTDCCVRWTRLVRLWIGEVRLLRYTWLAVVENQTYSLIFGPEFLGCFQ